MVVGSNPVAVTSTSDIASVSSKEFLHIHATTECRFTLKCVCDMIKTHSLLVTLAIFLSTFTRIHFMSTFFSRGILLVATESHVPLTTCSGLITKHLADLYDQDIWLQVGQLSIKAGWWDIPLTFCNLAKAFKHYYIFGFHLPEAIKTMTMIHYCYCLIVSGKWRRIIYCKADYIMVLYRNCNWKKRTLMLTFNFDIQNCQRFKP